jgi:hypothetical protein
MAGALGRHCAGPTSLRLVAFALYDQAAVEEFGPALVRGLEAGGDAPGPPEAAGPAEPPAS